MKKKILFFVGMFLLLVLLPVKAQAKPTDSEFFAAEKPKYKGTSVNLPNQLLSSSASASIYHFIPSHSGWYEILVYSNNYALTQYDSILSVYQYKNKVFCKEFNYITSNDDDPRPWRKSVKDSFLTVYLEYGENYYFTVEFKNNQSGRFGFFISPNEDENQDTTKKTWTLSSNENNKKLNQIDKEGKDNYTLSVKYYDKQETFLAYLFLESEILHRPLTLKDGTVVKYTDLIREGNASSEIVAKVTSLANGVLGLAGFSNPVTIPVAFATDIINLALEIGSKEKQVKTAYDRITKECGITCTTNSTNFTNTYTIKNAMYKTESYSWLHYVNLYSQVTQKCGPDYQYYGTSMFTLCGVEFCKGDWK